MPSVSKSAAVVAIGTFASRILGAVRDAVIAATFAVHATDAFFIAFTIPNSLRVLLGEGAVSAAFVPVLAEVRETRRTHYAAVFNALVGMMGIVLLATTILGVIFAPQLVTLYAAGYLDDPPQFDLTVRLTRLVFPYVFLVGLSALATASLNTLGKFALPSFTPVWLNVALIACAFALPSVFEGWGDAPIMALAVGVLLGGVLQVLTQLPWLVQSRLLGVPRLNWREPAVRKTLRLLVPLVAGLGVYQLNIMGSRLLASFLQEGSQSFLYYSQRLVEIPQGMIALAISSAALPTLAAQRSRGDHAEAANTLSQAVRMCLFLTVPAGVFLMAFAYPTVSILLGRGSFDPSHVQQTARALFWQATGIWAIAGIRTLVPAFHAHNDTRSPVVGSVVNLLVFIGSALLLMQPMKHEGIALAISLAGFAQLATLLFLLRNHPMALAFRGVGSSLAKIVAASAAMSVLLVSTARSMTWTHAGQDFKAIACYLGISIAAAGIYFLVCWLLGSKELRNLGAVFRSSRNAKP